MSSNVLTEPLKVEVARPESIMEADWSCPICGQLIDGNTVTQFMDNYEKHRCPSSLLRRMESRDSQASNHINDDYVKDLYHAGRIIVGMFRVY